MLRKPTFTSWPSTRSKYETLASCKQAAYAPANVCPTDLRPGLVGCRAKDASTSRLLLDPIKQVLTTGFDMTGYP